jgi:predicted MFS family arabinose efflux permease
MRVNLNQSRAKLATRLAFIAAGFGVACWAPLVPYAKARCQVGDGTMGLILLLLGVGSIIAMPLAANLSARFGSRPIVLSGGIGLAVALPLLSEASSPISLGAALFVFGAALGSLDVSMNLHAVDVERASEEPLMSGFHALFSIGGFLGSGIMTGSAIRTHSAQYEHHSKFRGPWLAHRIRFSAHAFEQRGEFATFFWHP